MKEQHNKEEKLLQQKEESSFVLAPPVIEAEDLLAEDFDTALLPEWQELPTPLLKNKLALITGASGGIGQAIAHRLAEMGASIVLHGFRHPEHLRVLKAGLELQFPKQQFEILLTDLTQPGAGKELIRGASKLLGAPDIFVHNAGLSLLGLVNDLTEEDYTRLQRIHLETPLFACQALFPHLLEQQWGRIVTVSSIWGLSGASCEVAYSAVKAGLIGLTKALAREWGPSGVTVNCVAPGVIDTVMNQGIDPLAMRALMEETPIGRLGTPAEVAEAVAYFVHPLSGFTTGQVISPNGGLLT